MRKLLTQDLKVFTHYPINTERDFPILPEKKAKHATTSYESVKIIFADIIYQIPETILHFLDDSEAIGFSWLPSKDFIDRIMKGGVIKLKESLRDQYSLQVLPIGYLIKEQDKIVNKFKYDHPSESVEMGQAPREFIDRIKNILSTAKEHKKNPKEIPSTIVLSPVEGYGNTIIPLASPRKLSYEEQFDLKIRNIEEEKGIEFDYYLYEIAKGLQFFELNANVAVANLDLIYQQIYRHGSERDKEARFNIFAKRLPQIFSYLDIQFDIDSALPIIKISNNNLKKLKLLGAKTTIVSSQPGWPEKIAATFGFLPKRVDLSTMQVTRQIHEFDLRVLKKELDITDLNLLTSPDLREKIEKIIGNFERIYLDQDKIMIDKKEHIIEIISESHHPTSMLMDFMQPFLPPNVNSCEMLFSGGTFKMIHRPFPQDLMRPLNIVFQNKIDMLYAHSFIHEVKKQFPSSAPSAYVQQNLFQVNAQQPSHMVEHKNVDAPTRANGVI